VLGYQYKGYWSPADTVKERAQMEEMYHRGNCPWMVWDPERSGQAGDTPTEVLAADDAEALQT
jgi:glucose-1-phosphate cytidylyltransferase